MSDPLRSRGDAVREGDAPPAEPPSVLFCRDVHRLRAADAPQPPCFPDLALDRILASLLAGREEYDLPRFYHRPLHDAADVEFRQRVMHDLEGPEALGSIKRFAEGMHTMRRRLEQSRQLHNHWQRHRWFLDATVIYCAAAERLHDDLAQAPLTAPGLLRFRDYLRSCLSSSRFATLRDAAGRLRRDLRALRYNVLIGGLRVQVRSAVDAADYGAEIASTFEPFRQAEGGEHRFEFRDSPDMNAVESDILERVARLWPEVFARLADFAEQHAEFADEEILAFDREIQFYLAYLDYLAPLRGAGLAFCYPRVTSDTKSVFSRGGFDLALAEKLMAENAVPVPNDFRLDGDERIIVVSGPNQSGKTTFARMFGQLHVLASLGCPVPGTEAQLYLFDEVLTHFERGEPADGGRGKLQDDLVRIHAIVEHATPASIVILNEIFSSTTARDASMLSRRIMDRLARLDLMGVWVTFLDELAAATDATVSMVGAVDPAEPAHRTFKIVRHAPEGLAHALSLAERHGLTSSQLRERLPS